MPFGTKKQEWCGYPMVKKIWWYVYSFRHNSRTWQTDRHTDTQIDTVWRHRPRLCIASCVKNRTVIDCLQLSDTTTRDDDKMTSFLKRSVYIFWVNGPTQNLTGWKRWVLVKKINAIWLNIKINLQKIGRYMWIWIANSFSKFHTKRLNRNENIPKRLRGYFFETPCI